MTNKLDLNRRFMLYAINLAIKGIGFTSPNPSVGAVVVKNGRIVGRGYHKGAGLPHAEINAIMDAGNHSDGADMYVTLEPCAHYGKTPPCVDAIIKSGIKRVVIGEIDPNPLVNGKGIGYLQRYGVKTEIYQNREEIISLNCGFRNWIKKRIPYVIVKIASSLDGRIADKSGLSKYLTSNESRRFVHFIRFISDAILVGAKTIINDDPLLDHRLYNRKVNKHITRVVLDGKLLLSPQYRVFRDDGSKRIILTSKNAFNQKKRLVDKFVSKGIEVVPFKTIKDRIPVKDILEYLGSINILYLLVEGGREVFTDFIENEGTDMLLNIVAPRLLGEGAYGFYKRYNPIEKSMTRYIPRYMFTVNNDSLLFYFKEGSDVYRIDRIYRVCEES